MGGTTMNSTFKTFILMAGLTGLFLVAGQALGGEQGMMLALFLALSMNFFAYWFSDKMALAMSRTREVTHGHAPELHALIGRLADQAGLPKPSVFVNPLSVGGVADLFSTHPPVAERIRRLMSIG